jgi:hypothetical protein
MARSSHPWLAPAVGYSEQRSEQHLLEQQSEAKGAAVAQHERILAFGSAICKGVFLADPEPFPGELLFDDDLIAPARWQPAWEAGRLRTRFVREKPTWQAVTSGTECETRRSGHSSTAPM